MFWGKRGKETGIGQEPRGLPLTVAAKRPHFHPHSQQPPSQNPVPSLLQASPPPLSFFGPGPLLCRSPSPFLLLASSSHSASAPSLPAPCLVSTYLIYSKRLRGSRLVSSNTSISSLLGNMKASRGFEPRSLDSESRVLTVTPRGQMVDAHRTPENVSLSAWRQVGPLGRQVLTVSRHLRWRTDCNLAQ